MLPQESLSNGAIGEAIVYDFFTKQKVIKDIIDVRDDKFFQESDVDFLFEDYNHQFTWVEVKTDFRAHESGCFVYEAESSSFSHTIGCFEKTKANVIAYYVPHSGHIYMMDVLKLRIFVKSFDLKQIKMGDRAVGYLLPIAELERHGVILKMYDAERVAKVNDIDFR